MIAAIANEGRQLVTEGLIRNFDPQLNAFPSGTTGAGRIYNNNDNGSPPAVATGIVTLTTALGNVPAYYSMSPTRYFTAAGVNNDLNALPISMACWFTPPATGTPTSYSLIGLGTGSSQKLIIYLTSGFTYPAYTISASGINNIGTTVTATNMNAGWNMLHVNYNTGTNGTQFYLNGILLGATTVAGGTEASPSFLFRADPAALGGATTFAYGTGLVYSRFLLPQEIQQNYLYYADRYQRYY
jgi:hypothetical protein